MRMPTVRTVVEAPEAGTRYVILAYRELTQAEVVQTIAAYRQALAAAVSAPSS